MKWKNINKVQICLLGYAVMLVWLLFFYQDHNYSRLSRQPLGEPNLSALKNIRYYFFVLFQTPHGFTVKSQVVINLLGNILLFVPAGYLIPITFRLPNKVVFMLGAMLIILCIELLQWVSRVGVFDVDDILLNTLGCLIGTFFCSWVKTRAT